MKRISVILMTGLLFALALALPSCSDGLPVSVGFAITDAPVDAATITDVVVTVSQVAVNESADATIADGHGSWQLIVIAPPLAIHLLDLQNGLAESLGELAITGGSQINQIRLTVDSVVVTDDTVEYQATLPSNSGLKIVNAFQVPLSGAVVITVDFDLRKSLVRTGEATPTYILKPVLRAIVDNEAGRISGSAPLGSVVYAYTAGSWVEATETAANADGLLFTGAYTSAAAKADGSFVLAFMDAGSYSLVAVNPLDNTILKLLDDVVVTEGATTPGVDLASAD